MPIYIGSMAAQLRTPRMKSHILDGTADGSCMRTRLGDFEKSVVMMHDYHYLCDIEPATTRLTRIRHIFGHDSIETLAKFHPPSTAPSYYTTHRGRCATHKVKESSSAC